jgi:uncharacterized protein with beta-barrel porin domain
MERIAPESSRIRGNGRGRIILGLVLVFMLMLAPELARPDDLTVDVSQGNSPYTVTSDINYFNEYIGTTAAGGIVNQSGYTNTLTSSLYLGNNTGSSGTYNLSNGSLSVGNSEYIGGFYVSDCSGVFTQSGGTHTINGDLTLGCWINASGSYTLSGGSLSAASESIGLYGIGTFTQSGGTHTVSGYLEMGFDSTGTYTLNGGSLSVGSDEVLGGYLGGSGTGTFIQNGGTHTANDLILAWDSTSSGSYDLRDGSLAVGGIECIGYGGVGTFTQSGGTHTIDSDFYLSVLDFPSTSGTYNLSGGSLAVAGAEYIGYGGTGTFTQSGGSHTATGGIWLGPGSTGTYTLGGGSLTTSHVDGNLQNGGTFTPMTSGTTISGNYTQTAAGTLEVQIASASTYSKLAVTGSASLDGALKLVLLNGFVPSYGQRFPGILTAAGGVTGTFSTLINRYITPTLYWNVLYSANSVDLATSELVVARNYTNPSLGLTPNQWQVGNMFNGLADTATGDLNDVLNAIDHLPTGAAVGNAFQQISADKVNSLSPLAFAGANLQRRGLANRITNLRYGGMGEAGGLGGLRGFRLNYSRLDGLMLAYNSSSLAGLLSAKREAAPDTRWGLYLNPGMVLGRQNSSVNQTGFDYLVAGFTAGVDYRVRDNLLLGLATGYSHTGADFPGSGGSVETNTWPIMAYAAYLPESFYAYGSLGYALNLFNLNRDIVFTGINRTATGSTTGNQFNAYGEAGYDLKARRLVVTPMVTLSYSSLWVDGFEEEDAGALNLKVSPQQADSLQTGVGAKVAVPLQVGQTKIVPQVYATYQHEFSDNPRYIDARLNQGSSTFAFQTERPQRDFAVVGGNVNLFTRKNLSVQLDYNTEVGRNRSTAHLVSAALRWEF